ncbi:CmcJ/NvfI family oxidoreductase [Streptomyces griseiscabiei]|uniref:CmcJ/NvfI family oxidoreductase n=1 Tax=Streptomyces griseiscabiei TaxID=2993540 RepID=A0ABU4LKJ6_9ACTN|nr:CmcJ/NvfI family oxidoreductase [Streptomyces griseiscabiei]MBZ3900358.1 hypothetical protein [Streptomyces griseiscabiei]MDX2916311.1 CmcJ/NvfI family oxidoreductase [Streptomyces griseiscabiei]
MRTNTADPGLPTTAAEVNYAVDTGGRGRFDVVEPERTNLRLDATPVRIADARPALSDLDLMRDGYTLVDHHSAVTSADDKQLFETVYLDEMSSLIQRITGAREVRPQRSTTFVRKNEWTAEGGIGPVRYTHLDYTPLSVESWLKLSEEDDGPIAPFRRVVIVQAWRALSESRQESSLALIDPATMDYDDDTMVFDARFGPEEFPSCFFELRLVKSNPAHRWLHFDSMKPDEVLLFQGYDSDKRSGSGVAHTAFDRPAGTPGLVPRHSVEARFLAFFE